MGRCNSTRVEGLKRSRDETWKARTVVGEGRGEESLLCDPESVLRLHKREREREEKRAKTMNGRVLNKAGHGRPGGSSG